MKLIKSSYEILEQGEGLQGIYEQIERVGKTCYKSEVKGGESAKEFVDRMIANQHTAMLEQGTVYLHVDDYFSKEGGAVINKYLSNQYSKVKIYGLGLHGRQADITTNYRVLVENDWLDDLKYICEPTKYHENRISVRFITDRGVSHKKFVA